MQQETDYSKIKFKAGLEIHQQLDSGKLFCRCPSILRSEEPDYVVERKLHAVPGESGEIDLAVLFQNSLKKKFFYQGYKDTTCLIELDEEPPREINQDALKTAIHIALHLNCKIQPITQIMRKTVIDGSNTSGFQRTVLIARDGFLETSQGKVKIEYIYLEEDAARNISREPDKETYRLDRLGIPLVEIVTSPDLKSPEHSKETALKIGEILRSCKVRRGIGTIRQDINISIQNGNRVEIKGMQDMRIFLQGIKNEIQRQQSLNKLSQELKTIKLNNLEIKDLTQDIKPKIAWMQSAIKSKQKFLGFKIPGLKNQLKKELTSNLHLGKELANYAKTRGFKGMIHSDEDLSKYSFSNSEISQIEKQLKINSNDAWILILGKKDKTRNLIENTLWPRIQLLKKGVINEVRNVLPDSSTKYLRPLPGSSRMYPETDLSLLKISKQQIDDSKKTLPKLISKIKKELQEQGLNQELIKVLLKENKLQEYKELLEITHEPDLIVKTLIIWPKEIAKHKNLSEQEIELLLNKDTIAEILENYKKSKIKREQIQEVLNRIASGIPLKQALNFEKIDINKIEEQIRNILKNKPGLNPNAYMGLIMKEFKGKINGKTAREIIEKILKYKN
ncbi:MAG: Glu-tRNA(Gln) amidotransferase subunit GatE [Nanoarchaeota archaeon]